MSLRDLAAIDFRALGLVSIVSTSLLLQGCAGVQAVSTSESISIESISRESCESVYSLGNDLSGGSGYLSQDNLWARIVGVKERFDDERAEGTSALLQELLFSLSSVYEALSTIDTVSSKRAMNANTESHFKAVTDSWVKAENSLEDFRNATNAVSKLCQSQHGVSGIEVASASIPSFREYGYWLVGDEIDAVGDRSILAEANSRPDNSGSRTQLFFSCDDLYGATIFGINAFSADGQKVWIDESLRKGVRVKIGEDEAQTWNGYLILGGFFPGGPFEQHGYMQSISENSKLGLVVQVDGQSLDFVFDTDGLGNVLVLFEEFGCDNR